MKSKTHLLSQNYSALLSTILLFLITIFNSNEMVAQSTITGIRFNGQNVSSANTTVMPPGEDSRTQIKTGETLPSGTRMIIPPGTILFLQTPGGRQVCGATQGKSIEYTVKINYKDGQYKGENHTVSGKGAQISSTVKKGVGYNYRVNNGRGTTSAAKGTEFVFTDLSDGNNERAVISTQEGSINIIDEVPVTIGGEISKNKRGEPLTKAISQEQNSASGNYFSSNSPVDYNDYNQAIYDVTAEINAIEDPEERADNLLCLGDLFMDIDQAPSAIDPYYKAYEIYNDYYGYDDLDTLESQLCVADALMYSKRAGEANNYIQHARGVLVELLEIIVEDLEYLNQLDYYDEEDIYAICDDLSDIYDLLGWSYEIQGDESESEYYYGLSDTVCND